LGRPIVTRRAASLFDLPNDTLAHRWLRHDRGELKAKAKEYAEAKAA
jgi:hypothetical protein